MIIIKEETVADFEFVYEVNMLAFDRPDEANLVDKLRASCNQFLSLIAMKDDRIVGHILFTPITTESYNGKIVGMGLGPMSVLPEYQNQGIGSKLVMEGLARIKAQGFELVVVLGHPNYYPKFGFVPACQYGISCEWDVSDEVFMVQIFQKNNLSERVYYRPEFSECT